MIMTSFAAHSCRLELPRKIPSKLHKLNTRLVIFNCRVSSDIESSHTFNVQYLTTVNGLGVIDGVLR